MNLEDLERQFKVVELLLNPEANVYKFHIENVKLMKMFYGYIESKKPKDQPEFEGTSELIL